jgi:hypothetical protein
VIRKTKVILTYEEDPGFDSCMVVTVEKHNPVTLGDMLEVMGPFLKACGFVFNGELEIVEEPDANSNLCQSIN